MSKQANLYVIAAPSGAGKTSLVRALVQRLTEIKISISHTTRKPRPGDVEGVDYFFTAREQFLSMVDHGDFLEYAEVYGHYYGTSRSWVLQQLAEGIDVILEIDWQGAQQIRHLIPSSISIFILPPSVETLEQRLVQRQQDDNQVISQRLAVAQSEIKHYQEFDYLIVNDEFEPALSDLECIIKAGRLRCQNQAVHELTLLQDLLRP